MTGWRITHEGECCDCGRNWGEDALDAEGRCPGCAKWLAGEIEAEPQRPLRPESWVDRRPLRGCKACGEPTREAWCSTGCWEIEDNGGRPA